MGWGPAAPDMTASNTAAASAAQIAKEQWQTTKDYMPEALKIARDGEARAARVADGMEADSQFYRDVTQHQFDRSKLSEPYQDKLYGMADDYASGKMGGEEAARANVDVEQEFANAHGSMVRSAGRYGLDLGSGAFASGMADTARARALAGASAQTTARSNARSKAEVMIAMAAGAGQGAFSNGVASGGLTGNSGSGAVSTAGAGSAGRNGVMGVYQYGANGAAGTYGNVAQNYRVNAIESARTPGFDFAAGLATGGMRMAGQVGGFSKMVGG